MKTAYARFVGRAHPSIRGYSVEHALRKLADDQRNPGNVAGIALKALHEGPHVLPILADELEETKHPMRDAYNWRAIPRGIAIDQAALAADREIGSPYPDLEYQPGNNISLAWLVDDGNQGIGEAARVRGHNALRRIRGRIADSVPDATPEEVSESIRRLALTRQDLTNSEAYPMLARQHHAKHDAIYPAAPGVSRHDDARRFRGTQVLLRRPPVKARYASFPGAAEPTVTVRVPVPTPAPMAKKKPQQPVLQKFGNTVAPAPPPQPAVPGMTPQQSQDRDFAPVAYQGPRTIIFPQSPPPKQAQPRQFQGPRRMARIQYPEWHDVWKQRGLGLAAKLLWRIAAEEELYPESGEIATVALATGYTGALPMLDRTLAEEGNPLAGVVHWKNVPKAVEINNLVHHWLMHNEVLSRSALRLFGSGSYPHGSSQLAAVALRRNERYSGLAKFVREMAAAGHSRGHVIHALSRISNEGGGTSEWGSLNGTPAGQPLVPVRKIYYPEYRQEPVTDRSLVELVDDPRTYFHLYPDQRFADPPEPEQPPPSPRGRRRMSRPQPPRLKMSREEMQSFLDHMRENPGDSLANIRFADWLMENGHPAVGFVLQKAFENPGSRRGTRRHPVTGSFIDNYHAMLPGHQGGPPILIGMSPHREPTPEGYVIAGVGIPGHDTPHYDPATKDVQSNNEYYRTLLQKHAVLSQAESRHLADLIKYEGQSPYNFSHINRRKADPHRWLTMLGVPMPKRRRRPKSFSRPTPPKGRPVQPRRMARRLDQNRRAFLRKLGGYGLDRDADPTAALIYADWLDENKQEAEANFIRKHIDTYGHGGYAVKSKSALAGNRPGGEPFIRVNGLARDGSGNPRVSAPARGYSVVMYHAMPPDVRRKTGLTHVAHKMSFTPEELRDFLVRNKHLHRGSGYLRSLYVMHENPPAGIPRVEPRRMSRPTPQRV